MRYRDDECPVKLIPILSLIDSASRHRKTLPFSSPAATMFDWFPIQIGIKPEVEDDDFVING